MDILKARVVWVGGRCYRKNNQVEYTVRTGYTGENEDEDDDHEFINNQEDEEEIDLQHVVDEFSGGFRASLQVSSNFFPLIIGKGGQIKIRLEKETGTRIVIPRKGLEGDIVVSGTQRHGVVRCCNRIDKMITSSRHKQPFTHFLSLPVNSNNLQQTFSKFKKEVLDNCSGSRGVEESIFQTSTLLHLTIGTMALFDERERSLARDILQDCKETLILPLQGETPFQVEISGLEIMNDDPSEVDVLYAKVDQADQLQDVAEKIIDRFVESGLMKREYERIKFHVTLINTLFRKDKNDVGDVNEPAGKSARETFDSRPILELYGNTSFGSVEISEIHLSQRRAGRRTPEGYYLPSAILNIVSCG